MVFKVNANDLDKFLVVLPPTFLETLLTFPDTSNLLEVVMDWGRLPEARFPTENYYLSEIEVDKNDMAYVISRIGEFGEDNRAGIERTLHRISAIRNRKGDIIGLTLRVGRALFGTMDIIKDVIASGKSILLLGKPGVGKTTLLREAARIIADELKKRVIVVDTSNEIAGDGDIPHPAIGSARRMQVPRPELQHDIMIEAVENHMPEVIIIDEIGREAEANAARTIAERGVVLIATAHGNTLDNLLQNPTLSDLVGGVEVVTLSDEEAKRRGTQKAVLERKAPPTFDILIEIQSWYTLAIHHDVAKVVDAYLRGYAPKPEIRRRGKNGVIQVVASVEEPMDFELEKKDRIYRVFPFGVNNRKLEKVIKDNRLQIFITRELKNADFVMALKSHLKRRPVPLREAAEMNLPLWTLKSNTSAEILYALRSATEISEGEESALNEAKAMVETTFRTKEPQELSPRPPFLRKLQHIFIQKHGLKSESIGDDPYRRVVIYP